MGTRGLPLLATTFVLAFASLGSAQTSVTLTDTSQTTTLTANVSEQARVTVPAGVTFTVGDVAASTAAGAASVRSRTSFWRPQPSSSRSRCRRMRQRSPPRLEARQPGRQPMSAWNAAAWTNATGAAGTSSNAAYNTVATCGLTPPIVPPARSSSRSAPRARSSGRAATRSSSPGNSKASDRSLTNRVRTLGVRQQS